LQRTAFSEIGRGAVEVYVDVSRNDNAARLVESAGLRIQPVVSQAPHRPVLTA
jgi:hypothetical protein